MKNGQSRETGNKWYTSRGQTKQNNNTICVRHHYAQTNTNNVRRVWWYQRGNQNRISKKNRQHNGQKTNDKDKQRSTKHTYQTKDRVTRTPQKPGVNWGAPEG